MNGSAIENSCITKYVYQVWNKIINQYNISSSTVTILFKSNDHMLG